MCRFSRVRAGIKDLRTACDELSQSLATGGHEKQNFGSIQQAAPCRLELDRGQTLRRRVMFHHDWAALHLGTIS
jgi:hypothetical protein